MTLGVLGAFLLGIASGCAVTEIEGGWTPPPEVHWDDISTGAVAPVDNGYRILRIEPTQGLFPASIGVTRMAVESENQGAPIRQKHLLRDPRNEFLRWNSAFDDQMAVSEVFPIDQRDLGGAPAEPQQVLAAFSALHARIGFMYAVNELSENETEMIGALYDVTAAEPIASIHARALSLPPPDEKGEEPVDLWKYDSRALVRAAFERHIHGCIRELISRDERAPLESRDGWTPLCPVRPVEWPPRQLRSGW